MSKPRWKQRFESFLKALQTLDAAMDLARQRPLTPLEQQGVIQSFVEYTHELAWNVLQDYLACKGIFGLVGSRDASRGAFQNGLIEAGEVWMRMIAARNLTPHTYDQDRARAIAEEVARQFYPAFKDMAIRFTRLYQQDEPCLAD